MSVFYKLKSNSILTGFTQDKQYKLGTEFSESDGVITRHLKVVNDKDVPILFYPKEFYKDFTLVK
jgi:hypothetical protein